MKSRPKQITFVQQDDDSEAASKPLDFDLIRRLLEWTGHYRRERALLILAVIARGFQLPALSWAIGAVLGGPLARLDMRGILLGAAGYALLAIVTNWTMRYRSLFALRIGEQVLHDLRNGMFATLQKQPMGFFHKVRQGRVLSRFISDAESVRVGVQDVMFVTMVCIGQMIFCTVLMLYYDWVLFLVLLAMSPVLMLMNRVFHRRMSKLHRASARSFSRITATMAESVKGIRVTQGFSRQQVNAGLFRSLVHDHFRVWHRTVTTSGVYGPLLEVNSQIFIALVLLVGGARVFSGRADMAALYQFVLVSGVFFASIQIIGAMYNHALSAMAGAERVFGLLDEKPEWSDPPDAAPVETLSGKIEFRNVNLEYVPGRTVLKNLDLLIEPGQTVALVGPTGCGKTSIINLISKFYLPTSGEVLIDGRNLLTLDSRTYRERLGIVLQQNFLFSGTVADNIRFGRPDTPLAEVEEVVRKLDFQDIVDAMPDGLQTVVSEGGSGISMGQRQLICFARAMLVNPAILFLDEATSAVDTLTELRIQKALEILLKGRTSIVVAHRLSTIRHADRVLVMDDGRIIESGTHEELLGRKGFYSRLYRKFITF
jgi:ATP-binding cassette, subfamily B, bacterial